MSGREREVRELEELLLGGELKYTRLDAARESGVPPEFTERLWRSFGFPSPADDVPAFTEGDLRALRLIRGILDRGSLGEDTAELVLRQARAFGQTMARLAEWQSGLLTGAGLDTSIFNADFLDRMEPLLLHAWRRQLAAAGARALASMSPDGELNARPLAVGFADMVSFTAMSRELNELELGRVVERFETTAADIVAAHGARLIKTLGDEVLYAADSARTGVEIGISISDAVQSETEVPDVRVGMAYGPVLHLMGDIFGTTVNLASRLTSIARPGSLVADEALAEELKGDSSYELVRIVRRPVRGLGIIQPYVVRRSLPG
ncbi:adenylate/guanylate cyclase domain-containing protein [Actinocorallia sp. API 0066]|uniref:adenylate/guanylate cyclase domain-containing protein n=1 Tax=Actinocorallia sp. API 0066 TaxID=2896846 RepID=UPI001E5A9010|nr:adenylate/guanylate cyclase domain-containing protein [Actinocorallia sp. API 0066]MCD0453059.1 adenylate/guanylate cyclase domain-containing protein [Actinocorallia sp. API 0066]